MQGQVRNLQEELEFYKTKLHELEEISKANLSESIQNTEIEMKRVMENVIDNTKKEMDREIENIKTETRKIEKEIENIKAAERKAKGEIENIKADARKTEKEIDKNIGDIRKKAEENIKNVRAENRKNVTAVKYELGRQLQYNFIRGLLPEQYKEALSDWYYKYTGERLDLANPRTFNQKVQWMKLYDNTPLKTKLSDKYAVREWISSTIGEEYLIPIIGVWDSFDEIDFDSFPNQFVLKANHGSGWNIIVKDKADFNKEKAQEQFHIWLGKNYAYEGFELHYKSIIPKIIAEQYIKSDDLYDYKFICLDEKPRYVCVYSQRFYDMRENIFDMEWNEQPVEMDYKCSETNIPKPRNFERMKQLAEKLCKGFSLVRIDFYNIDGRIYFGEMTFTPGNGKLRMEPKEFDTQLGKMVSLPEKKMFEGKML